jgi:excisionase family DNA binding protein
MSSSPDTLSLQEVAERLGVHYMTAYRYVRIGVLPAHKEGHRWVVRTADLEEFTNHDPVTNGDVATADWVERLVRRLVGGDEAGSWMLIEAALAAGHSPTDVLDQVVIPALRRIGDQWSSGTIGIDEEHIASAIAIRLVGRLGARFSRRGVPRGTVVIGTPPGELHALPAAIAAEGLRLAGFAVVDLGANLPPESFARAVQRADRLVAVVISATTPDWLPALEDTVRAVRSAVSVPVFLGGSGASPEVAERLGVTWADSMADLRSQVGALTP